MTSNMIDLKQYWYFSAFPVKKASILIQKLKGGFVQKYIPYVPFSAE